MRVSSWTVDGLQGIVEVAAAIDDALIARGLAASPAVGNAAG